MIDTENELLSIMADHLFLLFFSPRSIDLDHLLSLIGLLGFANSLVILCILDINCQSDKH